MKKTVLFVVGALAAALLLSACYAQIQPSDGSLGFSISTGGKVFPSSSQVVIMVANAEYEDELKEMIWLIDKSVQDELSSSEEDDLIELVSVLAQQGLVKFGGYPFFQTTISGASGSFDITGIPADRDYFVKVLVFDPGFSFDIEQLQDSEVFDADYLGENLIFSDNESYLVDWEDWTVEPGQRVSVDAGESTEVNLALAYDRDPD